MFWDIFIGILVFLTGCLWLWLILDFIIIVPRELKRIANAMEKEDTVDEQK